MPYIPIEPKDEYIEPKTEPVEVKAENPDADSDFLSDSDDEEKPKIEPGSVKTDPDIEMQDRNETLEEFKARYVIKNVGNRVQGIPSNRRKNRLIGNIQNKIS